MQHLVRHLTRFSYDTPVFESVMEVRMQPLTARRQRCLTFSVTTSPRARVFAYRDHLGNAVHYFDLPGRHGRLEITAEAAVDVAPPDPIAAIGPEEWQALEAAAEHGAWTDWLQPSHFAAGTKAVREFGEAIGIARGADPLTTLKDVMARLRGALTYKPQSTTVDSPIDDVIAARAGVCQDFAHIMIALVRGLGIPARYVSGYLVPRAGATPRDRHGENATHAWMEAYLPAAGWIGFDPTHDTLADDRHIAVGIGRDYQDVPPTRGVFKGGAGSELGVAVSISSPGATVTADDLVPAITWISRPRSGESRLSAEFYHQQQEQQQQQ